MRERLRISSSSSCPAGVARCTTAISSGGEVRVEERADLAGDELELGPLVATFEQAHGSVRVRALGAGLEQPSLEMAERGARARLVVLGARGQRPVFGGQRLERRERGRATRERGSPGLVGQRDRYLRVDDSPERLDRIELQGSEIVEAVEGHRRAAPQRRLAAQLIERHHRALLGIEQAAAHEQLAILEVERAERRCRHTRAVGRLPAAEGRGEALGRDPRNLELGHELAQRADVAGRGSTVGMAGGESCEEPPGVRGRTAAGLRPRCA